MSLDFYLTAVRTTTVLHRNITHNLGRMAEAAGIYDCLWRPGEHGFKVAADVIPVLRAGIAAMEADPAKFMALDASNGWGTYRDFLPWLHEVLKGCEENPDASIEVSV